MVYDQKVQDLNYVIIIWMCVSEVSGWKSHFLFVIPFINNRLA